MKNKQIHIVVKYFYPVAAGIETNILETYSVLAKKGWKITIHTSNNTLTQTGVLPKSGKIRGLKIMRYPFKWYGFIPDFKTKPGDIVALHNFDIFPHVHVMLSTLFKKLMGRKTYFLVLTPHGGYNPEWSIYSFVPKNIKRSYHYTLGKLLINLSVDLVRAVSKWEADQIIGTGVKGKIVKTIPNGVEDEAYVDVDKLATPDIRKQVNSLGRYIIQVGRIYKIKNYETTIKALKYLPEDIKFVIAGPVQKDTGYKESLEKLAKRLKVSNRVVFAGVIRGVDKYYLIKHAQMMVHMAIWESFCNVVHEGLSQGLVCIVANNTALPYLVKTGVHGYCVETHDYKAVAKKINYVLSHKNKEVIKKMEYTNKIYGLENSWASVAGAVERVYLNLDQNQERKIAANSIFTKN